MRIATFNIENLDEDAFDDNGDVISPSLATRISVLRPQLQRVAADVLCLQEVHGQETEGQPRDLSTLTELLAGTAYEPFHVVHTTTNNQAYDKRNLVILSRYPITAHEQVRNDLIPVLEY